MGNLSCFMAQNVAKVEQKKVVVSDRFKDGDKPVEWIIQPINSAQDKSIRQKCTKKVQVPGKKNQYTQEFDANEYVDVLTAACVVYPDLNNAELQDSYGVKTPHELLEVMLLPGELNVLATAVQEVNGMTSLAEDVEEVKNF